MKKYVHKVFWILGFFLIVVSCEDNTTLENVESDRFEQVLEKAELSQETPELVLQEEMPTAQESTDEIPLKSLNPDEALALLEEIIQSMIESGEIKRGPGQSILSKLKNIMRKLERGQDNVALKMIEDSKQAMDVVVNISGRGDKDMEVASQVLKNRVEPVQFMGVEQ